MALARTALALAPFILRAQTRRPGKRLAGVILSLGCMALSGLFLLTAAFVWVMKTYGAEFGFLVVGATFFIFANIIYFASRGSKVKPSDLDKQFDADPLSHLVPEEFQNDARVQALVEKIKEYPMGSTAAAVSLGFLISNQILGD